MLITTVCHIGFDALKCPARRDNAKRSIQFENLVSPRRRHGIVSSVPAHASPEPVQGLSAVCFSLIVDDLVFPNGTTSMGQLGGGGPQSLFGYQLYHKQLQHVGLAAGVGADLPGTCIDSLRNVGVLSSALIHTDCKTPRAWQLTESDGRRTQVWRTLFTREQRDNLLRPRLSALPPAFASAPAFHLGVHPEMASLELLTELRAAVDAHTAQGQDQISGPQGSYDGFRPGQGLLSVETFIGAAALPSSADLAALVRIPDIFSPNLAEAQSLVGPGTVQQVACRLLEVGVQVLTLRCGSAGSYVFRGSSGEGYHIPAYLDTSIVDVTGCGNAWCGAFLAAAQSGESDFTAGLWGSVAGSFMAECRAFPVASPNDVHAAAAERLAVLAAGVSRVSL